MKADEMPTVFERHLADAGPSLDALTVGQGFRVVTEFYRTTRVRRADLDADGDMLLFQWGICDWGRTGNPSFEYDLTRQVILARRLRDDEMRQLHLTFRFQPNAALEEVGSGNKWCEHPSQLDEFAEFVAAHPATVAVSDQEALGVDLHFEDPE